MLSKHCLPVESVLFGVSQSRQLTYTLRNLYLFYHLGILVQSACLPCQHVSACIVCWNNREILSHQRRSSHYNELKITLDSGMLLHGCSAPNQLKLAHVRSYQDKHLRRGSEVKHLAGFLLGGNSWFCKTKHVFPCSCPIPFHPPDNSFQPSDLSNFTFIAHCIIANTRKRVFPLPLFPWWLNRMEDGQNWVKPNLYTEPGGTKTEKPNTTARLVPQTVSDPAERLPTLDFFLG